MNVSAGKKMLEFVKGFNKTCNGKISWSGTAGKTIDFKI
jgi:hypothetical protein